MTQPPEQDITQATLLADIEKPIDARPTLGKDEPVTPPRPAGHANLFHGKRARRWLVLGLLFASLAHRWHGLGQAPKVFETRDEYHYMWAGMSLLSTKRPTSWSGLLNAYCPEDLKQKNRIGQQLIGQVDFDGQNFYMVNCALDHPPLYSLLAGSFARLVGTRKVAVNRMNPLPWPNPARNQVPIYLQLVRMDRARLLSLILYTATFLLLYQLGRRALGFEITALALVFYGFTAHIVLHNRLMVTESLSTPILLFSMVCLQRYLDGQMSEKTFGWLTVTLTSAALMTKVVAVCQAGGIFFILMLAGRRRAAWYPIMGVIAGLGIFLCWGAWQGWHLFWAVQQTQKARFLGFNDLEYMIIRSRLLEATDFNYVIFLGWLALFALAVEHRAAPLAIQALWLMPLIYLLGFVFFAAAPQIYGWHLQPFYPFLCLALATMVARNYLNGDKVAFIVLLVLLLPGAFHVLFMNLPSLLPVLRLGYAGGLAAVVGLMLFSERLGRRVMRLSLLFCVTVILIGEVFTVLVRQT